MKAFTAMMKEVFGLREGQNVMGFAAELKNLSYEDKVWFHKHLELAGHPCLPPTPPVV